MGELLRMLCRLLMYGHRPWWGAAHGELGQELAHVLGGREEALCGSNRAIGADEWKWRRSDLILDGLLLRCADESGYKARGSSGVHVEKPEILSRRHGVVRVGILLRPARRGISSVLGEAE